MNSAGSAFHVGAVQAPVGARFARSVEQADCAGFALVITAGMHAGARLRGRECMSLGASVNNDLILRDQGVGELHAEIARWNGAWALLCNDGPGTRALAPAESVRRGQFLRQRFVLGGATLVLTQRTALMSPRSPRWAWRSAAIVGPAMLVTLALALVISVAWSSPRAQAVPGLPDHQILVTMGWPDVRLGRDGQGVLTVSGYVDDTAQLERLHNWLEAQALGALVWHVRSGADSLNLVRQALAAPEVALDYVGAGRVRAQGTVGDMAVRDRLRLVANDLAGIVSIDDCLTVVDAQHGAARVRPLPFRILDVAPGPMGHFRTDTGARYFVGATLSDGAEVVAITEDAIEFQIGERRVVYPLK